MHPTCHSKLSSTSVIPYEIAIKRFSINTKRAGDNKMSRKSDSVRRPLSQSRCGLSTLGKCQPGRGREYGPDFYQAIKSAMSSECPVPPLSCCCCRLSQKSKERPSVSDIEPEPNKQPPTQLHNKQPTTHPPMQGKHFNTPLPSPGYPLVHSALLMVILKRA